MAYLELVLLMHSLTQNEIANDNNFYYSCARNSPRIITMKLKLIAFAVTSVLLTGCGSSGDANTVPVFAQTNYTLSINEDTAGTLTVSATDKNNDSLTYSLANAAANGAANVDASSGKIDYTPNANFNGEDSFQVAVSDGEDSVTATVSVMVAAVNDAPVINMDSVIVSGGEVKSGQVNASDIDGDTLSYSITQDPTNGMLTIDSASGAITYTPMSLANAEDSFELTVNDGNGGLTVKQIMIGTNLATNNDRAYYYYASEMSHLRRAEALQLSLQDDISTGNINAVLADGYAEAGLTNEVNRLITEDAIVRDEIRAIAMLNVAKQYNKQNRLEEANNLREQASALYTQYVGTKGISNFNTDDQEFFVDLAFSYQEVGEHAQVEQSFGILDILLTSALDGEQTTAALRLFFGFRNQVEEMIATWQSTRTQSDYDNALNMTERLHRYASLIGYRYVSNDRNGNEGKPYFSSRQVGLSDVIESYIALNKLEEAKGALADSLALHGYTGYDENYAREPHEYAEVTHIEYPFGYTLMAPHFVTLYPELDVAETYLTAFKDDAFWYEWAKGDAEEAVLMAEVRNNSDKDAALARILASRDDNDLRELFTTLIAFNSSNPGASRILIEQGEYAAAAKYVAEGLKLINESAYLDQNKSNHIFVTGKTGCRMMMDQLLEIADHTGEQAYREQAIETLTSCRNIATTVFGEENGIDIYKENVIDAHIDLIKYHKRLGQEEHVAALVAKATQFIATYNEDEIIDKALDYAKVGIELALGGQFIEAQNHYNLMIEAAKEVESSVDTDDKFLYATRFYYYRSWNDYTYAKYLSTVKAAAGSIENYSTVYTNAMKAWGDFVAWNVALLPEASLQQQVKYFPVFADHYTSLNMFDEALALKDAETLGDIEKNSIVANVIQHLSTFDAFTASSVATVDTDFDGKANFFAPWVTEEMITNSGIELDLDSDNDGVNDDSDAYPLDPSKN